ncbi:polyprenyl diphosphate synthase [Patescibacteria group bacterium]
MPKKKKYTLPRGTVVPDHIAVVLDGNGRWARSRGLPPTKGHEEASKRLKELMDASREFGVHTLTLWGFSTENWKRPPMEIRKIMSIIESSLLKYRETAHKEQVRFVHLGRKDRLPRKVAKLIQDIEEETKDYNKYLLNIALDYGGRDEILRAVRKIVKDKVPIKKIDEELFSSYLDTANQPYPYPDLFVRTSGEQRTSGFLPWQMAYSEYYWEQCHLPDLTPEKVKDAIIDYSRRRRRFGGKDKAKHLSFQPEISANLELAWWRLRKVPEGERFRDFAVEYLKEQYGLSKKLASEASHYMVDAVKEGDKNNWKKAKVPMKKFYVLVKDHLKLAFEPDIAASLRIKLWKGMEGKNDPNKALQMEETARNLLAEQYRMSQYQASKAAHLRILAKIERNLAEENGGEVHWKRAEDYLHKYYQALKERVA